VATKTPHASPLAKGNAQIQEPAVVARATYPLAPRFWAAQIDFVIAIILILVVGKQLDEYGQLVQLVAVVGVCFVYFFYRKRSLPRRSVNG
jgi:hypothetical protein